MAGQEAKGSILSGDRTYFVPTNPTRLLLSGAAKRWNVWRGAYLDSDDFDRGDLLLLQDQKGRYWWAFFENLFKQDSKMRLHSCSLNHREADFIVKKRILFIADSDLRLSDFSLLSKTDKPPTLGETLEKLDLATRHLASTREVTIFRIGLDGKRTPDEVRTADYCRAKADIRRDPADTRNMRRFCNRQGWNGEGPSNLDSRVCHGYVRPSWSPSTPRGPSRKPSRSNSSSTLDKPDVEEIRAPIRRHRKHTTAYHVMRLAGVCNTKLEAEQYRYDLKLARREKKPEGYGPPSRWTAVVKQVRGFYCQRLRKRLGNKSPASKDPESEKNSSGHNEGQHYPSSNLSDYSTHKGSNQCSSSPSLVYDEDISPLTLPAPAVGATGAAHWVETHETFPGAEIIDGVKSAGPAFHQPRHDSLGEGITGECDSKAAFADPGVSTTVVREEVKRCWVEAGGWEWMFNEGMG